ncbi:MAG TPA: tetratricopeptide repeat protein [Spirochaetota bacterium]
MHTTKVFLRIILPSICLIGVITIAVLASGGGSMSSGSDEAAGLYKKGVASDRAGDYRTALAYFKDANDLDSNNPDILNMLAHSQRKLGMIDEALDNYKRALRIRPEFPEAREYLGEAYVQAALREIDILKTYGDKGAESRRDLIKALKDAANGVK